MRSRELWLSYLLNLIPGLIFFQTLLVPSSITGNKEAPQNYVSAESETAKQKGISEIIDVVGSPGTPNLTWVFSLHHFIIGSNKHCEHHSHVHISVPVQWSKCSAKYVHLVICQQQLDGMSIPLCVCSFSFLRPVIHIVWVLGHLLLAMCCLAVYWGWIKIVWSLNCMVMNNKYL